MKLPFSSWSIRIILLKSEGVSINEIADKVSMNRKSVMLYLSKKAALKMLFSTFLAAAEMPRLQTRKNMDYQYHISDQLISVMLPRHGPMPNLLLISIKLPELLDIQDFQPFIKVRLTLFLMRLR